RETARFARVIDVVQVLRNLRSELGVAPGRRGRALLRPADATQGSELAADAGLVALLAKLEAVEVVAGGEDPHPAGVGLAGTVQVFLPMAGLVDLVRERERLGKELARVEGWVTGCRRKLANESFVSNAPAEVVAKQRELLEENELRARTLRERLAALD
ncbi:MAG: valine--tRNA ligase, partial [Candidatus Krumholzibacteriia bacterium]